MCTVASPAFYRYVLRLGEAPLDVAAGDRAQLDVLANVPHAYADEEECSGDGWRIVPAMCRCSDRAATFRSFLRARARRS